MSNAELIAEVRAFTKSYATPLIPSWWKLNKISEIVTALEKSEAEVARLGGVIDEVRADARVALILHADDKDYNNGVQDQARDTLGILDRATVSAEGGAE